ncbi:MAG: hypothetical protein P4L83_06335 [Nevskia sp.]|nr:hypothetical protein [Nevskia sp.]
MFPIYGRSRGFYRVTTAFARKIMIFPIPILAPPGRIRDNAGVIPSTDSE